MDVAAVSKIPSAPQPLPLRKLPRLPAMVCPAPSSNPGSDKLQLLTATGKIPAVTPLFAKDEPELPPIQVEKRDNYTYYRNAFGQQITQVDYPEGKYFFLFSSQGLGIMLRQHDDKRDTLNFSDMNFNIGKPSQIPNVYFHVPHASDASPSKMSFNARHEVQIDLGNGEQLRFDRETSEHPLQGPVSLRFFPDETGQNFDVIYCGSDSSVKRFKSKGDTIQW